MKPYHFLSYGLLFLFITLKLIGKIDWSWWWITAPAWGTFLLIMLLAIPAAIRKAERSPDFPDKFTRR